MAHIYTFLRQYLLSLSKNGIMIYFTAVCLNSYEFFLHCFF